MKLDKNLFWTSKIALIISFVGFVLLILFSILNSFNDWSWIINPELADNYGSLIGGVIGSLFSLAGIFLLYETIIKQQNTFNIQQFESKFFELLKFHRENVRNIVNYRVPSEKKEQVSSSSYFVELIDQFDVLYKSIEKYSNNTLRQSELINITLLVLYYGVSNKTRSTLEKQLDKYESSLVKTIINNLRKLKTNYDSGIVYYGGHQHRLSHYLRHLSQSVKFVDRSEFLKEDQKYEYIKLLRAQMTLYELKFLFYVSFTHIGSSWEKKYSLITKYKLIKNLPEELGNNIKPKTYYKLQYDWES